MNVSAGRLLEHARSEEGRKQLRYIGVSVVFVPLGQVFIQIFGLLLDRNYTAASVISAAILTLPNFFANKYLVWKVSSRDNLRTQVLVFWVAAMLGVSLATGLTWLVEKWANGQSTLVEALSVMMAQMIGFGVVWVGRYLLLDKWLFKVTHDGAEPTPEEIEDLHHEFPI